MLPSRGAVNIRAKLWNHSWRLTLDASANVAVSACRIRIYGILAIALPLLWHFPTYRFLKNCLILLSGVFLFSTGLQSACNFRRRRHVNMTVILLLIPYRLGPASSAWSTSGTPRIYAVDTQLQEVGGWKCCCSCRKCCRLSLGCVNSPRRQSGDYAFLIFRVGLNNGATWRILVNPAVLW